MNCEHNVYYRNRQAGGLNPRATCSRDMYMRAGLYCYGCGKFLGKDPEDIEPETQETWHDRPPLL